ncbi:MAG: bifunctional oligoribonuclease/PAP phosphatase NrnA [Planctomycetes bacterium]|nr:bifunctional oligoribonuclease/PAP phosphatase NrnA [Planctomycetota bacterium]
MNDSGPARAKASLMNAGVIGLFGHERPDGDCIGSLVAVAVWLDHVGRKVHVFVPDGIPERYLFLSDHLPCRVNPHPLPALDVACALDAASPERLGDYAAAFRAAPLSMVIDHHPGNTVQADVSCIDCAVSSTAELVFEMIGPDGVMAAPPGVAAGIYTGIVTDTGRFSFGNSTPAALRIVAGLVENGVRPDRMTDLLYRSRRPEEMLIEAGLLSSLRLYDGGRILVMSVDRTFLKHYPDVKLEDLAARTLEVRDVLIGVMLLEIAPGQVKISLRGRDGTDVGAVARRLGGGGHLPASGARLSGTIEEVEAAVLKEIRQVLKPGEGIL